MINIKKQNYIKDLFSCTGNYIDKKDNLDKLGINENTINEIKNIKNIIKYFSRNNRKVNIFLDLCEVDDKNYHSGVRFTFFANNIRGEIAKGGRYIIDSHDKNDIGTGFTCYMDSILRASSIKRIENKVLVPFDTSKSKIRNLLKKEYSIVRYMFKNEISKKTAKDQRCQFYLQNNNIKKS